MIGAGGSTAKAEHWNGTTWTIDAVPKPSGATEVDLNAISCASSTSCHAAGSFLPSNASFPRLTLVEVWNGTKWSVQSSPNRAAGTADSNQLEGVSCVATSCTAVGSYDPGLGPTTLIESGG